jgi:hypothetical protein
MFQNLLLALLGQWHPMQWVSLACKQGWWIVMKNIVRRYLSVVGHGTRMSGRFWEDTPGPYSGGT